jgi:hypothetical protein
MQSNEANTLAPSAFLLRQMLEEAVVRYLLGPADGPEEDMPEDSVLERYLVGMLAPLGETIAADLGDEVAITDVVSGEDGVAEGPTAAGSSMQTWPG